MNYAAIGKKCGVLFMVLLLGSAVVQSVSAQEDIKAADYEMSEEAFAYVMKAMALFREHSYRADQLDWNDIIGKTLERARGAQTTADSYKAINFGARLLGDRHSGLIPPRKGNSARAHLPPQFRDAPLPKGVLVQSQYAYLWIPGYGHDTEQRNNDFARLIQSYVQTLARYEPKGWVVDLRDNDGGDMWPMVAGLGPLLGEGAIGSFTLRGQTQSTWKYLGGSSIDTSEGRDEVIASVGKEPVEEIGEGIPIAVLIGPNTASSGEATLVAFLGKPNVRTFGMPTFGVPTANEGYPLPDGALLLVAESYYSDRLGIEYHGPIAPDSFVRFDPTEEYGDYRPDDPVIERAVRWIDEQTKTGEEGEKEAK